MNEIDFAAAVLVSSGAGWYAGFYIERQKAIRAYTSMVHESIAATSKLANAAISLMHKYKPDADPDDLAKELVEEGKKYGMNAVLVPKNRAAAMLRETSVDNDKT